MRTEEAGKAGAFDYAGEPLQELTRRLIEMSAVTH